MRTFKAVVTFHTADHDADLAPRIADILVERCRGTAISVSCVELIDEKEEKEEKK
jgi:hypothetical protein